MIYIIGNTFPHRDLLKQAGARWEPSRKFWYAPQMNAYFADQFLAFGLQLDGYAPYVPPPPPPKIIVGNDQTWIDYFDDVKVFIGFNNFDGFLDYIDDLKQPTGYGTTDHYWTDPILNRRLHSALQLAREGWTEGLGLIPKLSVDEPKGKKRFNSRVGGSVNIGRMLAGNPMHMKRRRKAEKDQFIKLFVDVTNAEAIADEMETLRAFMVAAMVDLLENEGYRCEIYAVCVSRGSSGARDSGLCVKIKEYGERLNLLNISFALGHPRFCALRNIVCFTEPLYYTKHFRGLVDDLSDVSFADNEFYIPPLRVSTLDKITNDPLSMIPLIEPEGLPVKIRKD